MYPSSPEGANWVPADSFVGTIEQERYEELLGAAQEANMNMLRVWGGGIYEHDAFYDLCDEKGLLVWQDFMFACATYPEEPPQFVAEVDAGRFVSEFGMHAAPVYETLRRAIPSDQLYYHSPSMDHHNKDDPKNKGDNLMRGCPKTSRNTSTTA